MKKAYLLLGSNLGDRLQYLKISKSIINDTCGVVLSSSSVYETAAWGKTDQPSFLNQVIAIETPLSPEELLESILEIETNLGRKRGSKYDSRTIDIDILYYQDEKINSDSLTIPHPKISERRFVLIPMAEIAPEMTDPAHGQKITQLLELCEDTLEVTLFKS